MFLVAALSLLVIGLVYPELMNSDIPSTVANIGGWKSGGWGVGGGGAAHGSWLHCRQNGGVYSRYGI